MQTSSSLHILQETSLGPRFLKPSSGHEVIIFLEFALITRPMVLGHVRTGVPHGAGQT